LHYNPAATQWIVAESVRLEVDATPTQLASERDGLELEAAATHALSIRVERQRRVSVVDVDEAGSEDCGETNMQIWLNRCETIGMIF
jgi:hypothetical protein